MPALSSKLHCLKTTRDEWDTTRRAPLNGIAVPVFQLRGLHHNFIDSTFTFGDLQRNSFCVLGCERGSALAYCGRVPSATSNTRPMLPISYSKNFLIFPRLLFSSRSSTNDVLLAARAREERRNVRSLYHDHLSPRSIVIFESKIGVFVVWLICVTVHWSQVYIFNSSIWTSHSDK